MSIFKNANKILFTALVLSVFTACSSSDFTVNSSFSNTKDIQEGTLVYFEDQTIGKVVDVEIDDDGVKAVLSLDKEAVGHISARAAIVVNRMKEGAPLEIYNRTPPEGDLLLEGQSIKGFDSMFQLGAWMVGDSIKLGSNTVSEYLESFQSYLQSDDFSQDKQEVRQQIDAAKGVAQDAMRQVEEELSLAVDEIANSEERAVEVIEELSEELAPVVQELAGSGAQLITQLEEFARGLEQSDSGRQQAGEKFLSSLIEAMEKLNEAMEDGAQENPDLENEVQK